MKPVRLRGHHLLCVHGFRGMGYSLSFVEKMWEIVARIRDENDDFLIEVVAALDEACLACPHHGETACEAGPDSDAHVRSLDGNVIRHLGLEPGNVYWKSELIRRTAERVKPDDLDELCRHCSWLPYGVCKEGIANVRRGNVAQT
ncbi:DUF1284 domain-containing protein [Geobacillus thermoleovorans]|uniref:DUF1284 domain-containing protein n=1 Tax=Geobacillus thermoleovorans group TaxID=1505648 RepID=UPI0005CCA4FC|nr:DUF1284 domain-containing protein [Geobacillus kaustophilus]